MIPRETLGISRELQLPPAVKSTVIQFRTQCYNDSGHKAKQDARIEQFANDHRLRLHLPTLPLPTSPHPRGEAPMDPFQENSSGIEPFFLSQPAVRGSKDSQLNKGISSKATASTGTRAGCAGRAHWAPSQGQGPAFRLLFTALFF